LLERVIVSSGTYGSKDTLALEIRFNYDEIKGRKRVFALKTRVLNFMRLKANLSESNVIKGSEK